LDKSYCQALSRGTRSCCMTRPCLEPSNWSGFRWWNWFRNPSCLLGQSDSVSVKWGPPEYRTDTGIAVGWCFGWRDPPAGVNLLRPLSSLSSFHQKSWKWEIFLGQFESNPNQNRCTICVTRAAVGTNIVYFLGEMHNLHNSLCFFLGKITIGTVFGQIVFYFCINQRILLWIFWL
jgi:hypothetical protein